VSEHIDDANDDPPTYTFSLTTELPLREVKDEGDDDQDDEFLDESEYFTPVTGEILCDDRAVGRVRAVLIAVHRMRDVSSTMDSRDSETFQVYEALFDRGGVMKPAVAKLYEQIYIKEEASRFMDPLLFVERIEVMVAHRGRDVGLHAMTTLLDFFEDKITLAVCQPHPLQHERDAIDTAYVDAKRAELPKAVQTKALQRYWSRAGFHPIGRSGFYAKNVKYKAGRP
jgi:hypothetical protein